MSVITLSAYAYAQNLQSHPLTRAETKICKSLKHCLDILDRHGPDEFDYGLLQDAIFKFGPAGETALLRRLSSQDKTALTRAQKLLAKRPAGLSPAAQTQIAALWPRGDLNAHAVILQNNLSPNALSRVIETLTSPDETTKALSRDILDKAAIRANSLPPLPSIDYNRLAKAAIKSPTLGMVTLLAKAAPQTSQPILSRILRSGDKASTIAAYDVLFIQNPETAFQSLIETLYDLKNTEAEAAFALAAMLRARHLGREDGFYLKFASDVAKDPKMGPMGRLAGFDAVMRFPADKRQGRAQTALTYSTVMAESLQTALANMNDVPLAYIENLDALVKDEPQSWVKTVWNKLKADPYKNPQTAETFFSAIAKLPAPITKDIVRQALSDKKNFGMVVLGLKTAAAQKDKSRLTEIDALRSHPISDVRAYAHLARKALQQGGAINKQMFDAKIRQDTRAAKMCRAQAQDFTLEARQLPYFDLLNVAIDNNAPKRSFVTTAAPTQRGWLVGYAAGLAGGDLQYYDNQSGQGFPVLRAAHHSNVKAIMPVTPQPLGQYASEFWAIISTSEANGRSAIYRISQDKESYRLTRHAELPRNRLQIAQQANGDVFMSFYDETDKAYLPHPPLLLSQNGGLRRACEAPSRNILKALP